MNGPSDVTVRVYHNAIRHALSQSPSRAADEEEEHNGLHGYSSRSVASSSSPPAERRSLTSSASNAVDYERGYDTSSYHASAAIDFVGDDYATTEERVREADRSGAESVPTGSKDTFQSRTTGHSTTSTITLDPLTETEQRLVLQRKHHQEVRQRSGTVVSGSSSGYSAETHVVQMRFRCTMWCKTSEEQEKILTLKKKLKLANREVRVETYTKPVGEVGEGRRTYIAPMHQHLKLMKREIVTNHRLEQLTHTIWWLAFVVLVSIAAIALVTQSSLYTVPAWAVYLVTGVACVSLLVHFTQCSRSVLRIVLKQLDFWIMVLNSILLAVCDSVSAYIAWRDDGNRGSPLPSNSPNFSAPLGFMNGTTPAPATPGSDDDGTIEAFELSVVRVVFAALSLCVLLCIDAVGKVDRRVKGGLFALLFCFFVIVALVWRTNYEEKIGTSHYDVWLLPRGWLAVHIGTAATSAASTLAIFCARYAVRYLLLKVDCALIDFPFEVVSLGLDNQEVLAGEEGLATVPESTHEPMTWIKVVGTLPIRGVSAEDLDGVQAATSRGALVADAVVEGAGEGSELSQQYRALRDIITALDYRIFTPDNAATRATYSFAPVKKELYEMRGARMLEPRKQPRGFSVRPLIPSQLLKTLTHPTKFPIFFGVCALLVFVTTLVLRFVGYSDNSFYHTNGYLVTSIAAHAFMSLVVAVHLSQLSRSMMWATLSSFDAWFVFGQLMVTAFVQFRLYQSTMPLAVAHITLNTFIALMTVFVDCIVPPLMQRSSPETGPRMGDPSQIGVVTARDENDAFVGPPSTASYGTVNESLISGNGRYSARSSTLSNAAHPHGAFQDSIVRVQRHSKLWRRIKGLTFGVLSLYYLLYVFLWQRHFSNPQSASETISFGVDDGNIATVGQASCFMLFLLELRFAYRYLVLGCTCMFLNSGVVEVDPEEELHEGQPVASLPSSPSSSVNKRAEEAASLAATQQESPTAAKAQRTSSNRFSCRREVPDEFAGDEEKGGSEPLLNRETEE